MTATTTEAAALGLDPAQGWVVRVVLAAPRQPSEAELVAMDELAEQRHHASVAASVDRHGAVFTGDGDPGQVVAWATATAAEVLGAGVRMADLRVTTPDQYEAEALRPDMPELAGVAEAAELVGVTRQRLAVLRQRPEFPAPLVELAQGPVWAVPALRAFLDGWGRRVGRPPLREAEAL